MNVRNSPKRTPEAMVMRRCQTLFSSADGRVRIHTHEPMPRATHATMKNGTIGATGSGFKV